MRHVKRMASFIVIGTSISTNINPSYTGDWKTNNDGSRTWKLRVKANGAEALSFLFSKFELFGQSKLEIQKYRRLYWCTSQ
jgi:hypothetical protein